MRPKPESSKVPLLAKLASSVDAVKRRTSRKTVNPRRETAFGDEMAVASSSSLETFAPSRRDSTEQSVRSRYDSVDYTLEPRTPFTPRFNEPQTPTTPLQFLEPADSVSQLLRSPSSVGSPRGASILRRSPTQPFRLRRSSQFDSETELTAVDHVVSGARCPVANLQCPQTCWPACQALNSRAA